MFGISDNFVSNLQKLDNKMFMALKDYETMFPEKEIMVAGKAVHYQLGGQGDRTIVILPGTTGRAANYFMYFNSLGRDFKVLSLNYPLVDSVEEAADMVEAVVASENLNDCIVVGHSVGGIVAQEWVRKYPNRVKGMVLLHTYGKTAAVPKIAIQGHLLENTRLVRSFRSFKYSFFRKGFAKRISSGITNSDVEDKFFWGAFTQEIFVMSTPEEMKSNFGMMLYFWQKMIFKSEEFEPWKGKTLIIESEIDKDGKRPEKEALLTLFPSTESLILHGSSNMSIVRNLDQLINAISAFSKSA